MLYAFKGFVLTITVKCDDIDANHRDCLHIQGKRNDLMVSHLNGIVLFKIIIIFFSLSYKVFNIDVDLPMMLLKEVHLVSIGA